MSESAYDKANKRSSKMTKIYNKVLSSEITNRADRELYAVLNNPLKYAVEFDQIKKEFPDTFSKYLKSLLDDYEFLQKFNKNENQERQSTENVNPIIYDNFSTCLEVIVKHLTEMLNPETEPQEQPQKFVKLLPIEKLLIIHYLKIESLKRCQLGLKPGVFFLSRLLDINPESIKKPLLKLDDYTVNELTEGQAQNINRTLEKVKLFFDESELNEISKVIEIRINALKRILGKD